MAANGYDSEDLATRLGYSTNWVANIINGRRPIGLGLQGRFVAAFGQAEYENIFGVMRHVGQAMNRLPEQTVAQMAVNDAVNNGALPHQSSLKCHGCNKQARDYHHASYHPNDRLCVVPLCRSCHRRVHFGSLNLTFGVVPTSVGLIRIAIAYQQEVTA